MNMLKGIIIAGIVMLLLFSAMGGAMSSNMKDKGMHNGYFKGTTFNNRHIIVNIEKDYAVIKNAESGEILVEKAYPVVEIKEGDAWREIEFEEKFMEVRNHGNWHIVAIGFAHTGKIDVRGFLEYYQKKKISEGEPLYPLLMLYFNRSAEHRVVWRYEGIATNWFEIVDNGTGETRAPFKEGHARRVIYNGTIHGEIEFEDGQDIVIAWKNGEKEFGLNWEREKMRFKKLKFDVEDEVNMEIEEDESSGKMLKSGESSDVTLYDPPIPDSGGGGGDDNPGYTDSDGDGLPDISEEAGWNAYWYDKYGTKHVKYVTSDPDNPDTDYDGVSDKDEWAHLLNPRSKDTDGDSMPDKYEVEYGNYNGGWQDPHRYNERYAIIIVGGGYNDPYEDETQGDNYAQAFWNDGVKMYNKLVNDYNYKSSNVYLLSSRWYSKYDGSWAWRGKNPSTDSRVDGEVMWNVAGKFDIKDALDAIATKITVYDSLTIVIITHGGPGGFEIRADVSNDEAKSYPNTQATSLGYESFGSYINSKFGNGYNRKYAVIIVVNQACYSGTMISYLKGENRILISSAKSNEESYTEIGGYEHFAFIYEGRRLVLFDEWTIYADDHYPGFILSLGSSSNPKSVQTSFDKGYYAATHNYKSAYGGAIYGDGRSHPQLTYEGVSPDEIYL